MDLYEKIKILANEKKISIRQLEEALGFGNGVINRWRKNTPGVDKVQLVANYFATHLTIDPTLDGFDHMTKYEKLVCFGLPDEFDRYL